MRSARSLLLVAVTTATVLLTGCSTTVAGSPGPLPDAAGTAPGTAAQATANAPTTADPVAWADKVCGSLLPFVKAAGNRPDIDKSDPAKTVKSVSDYLGQSITGIDQSLTSLDAAGPGPAAGDAAVVTKIKDTLTKVKTSFAQAKDILDKVNPNDVGQVSAALLQAATPLQQLSTLSNPIEDLPSKDKAPNCQTLDKLN